MNELIEISLHKILQTRIYSVIVLGTDQKQFSIYMEPHIGQMMQSFFSSEKALRPQTFDFIDRCFLGLNVKVLRVIINDLQETTFFSKILCEQNSGEISQIVEIDARPSDSLILALRHHAPIYCSQKVFQETIAFEEDFSD